MASPSDSSSFSCGISHIGLAVSDIDASFTFFDVLGFKKVGGDEAYPSYFISNDKIILTLWKTNDNYNTFDRKMNVGLHHLALQVETNEKLVQAYEAVLKVPGAKSEFGPQTFPFGTHAMVYDPSGIRIELAHHL
jgi:lactoylglutathione lyase